MRENRRAAEGTHAQLRGRWAGRHPQPRAPPTGGRRRALGQVPQPLRPPPRAPRRPRRCQTSWPGTSWSRGRHRCAKGSAARPRASLVARQGPGAPGLGLRRGPRPGGPGEASPGVPRSPRPSPVEGRGRRPPSPTRRKQDDSQQAFPSAGACLQRQQELTTTTYPLLQLDQAGRLQACSPPPPRRTQRRSSSSANEGLFSHWLYVQFLPWTAGPSA